MCWSAAASLIFAILGLGCTAFLLREGRKAESDPSSTRWTKAAKWHALFVGNIACVELCEFFIWLDVLPFEKAGRHRHCPTMNAIFTYGVFVTGFVDWMWIIALWCYKSSNEGKDKDKFLLWLVLGIITAVGYVVKMILGNTYHIGVDYWSDDMRWPHPNATYPVMTCSYHDPTQKYDHLIWRFNVASMSWLPSGFSWFTVGLLPMIFYKPVDLAVVCFIWGLFTYAIPKMVLPVEETMSVY